MDCGFPKSWISSILKITYWLAFLSATAFLCWNFYLMRNQIEENRLGHLSLTRQIEELQASSKSACHGQDLLDLQAQLSAEFEKKYSALEKLLQDPVGRPDFALQSTGGQVISTKGDNYYSSSKICYVFSHCEDEWDKAYGPSAMIQANTSPGDCWAFKGQKASATIQLIGEVKIDAVTLEHIPPSLSPTGNIDSAPKEFRIWGLSEKKPKDEKKILLGIFKYSSEGSTLQTFPIENSNYYKYIQFEVVSNHGNVEFTCVYRIRVHGTLKQ